ncbi:uncharacterized protein METZ01_LOCUS340555, partial [marine metagenome]
VLTTCALVVFLKCSIFISNSNMVPFFEYSLFKWANAIYLFNIGDQVPL